MGLILNKALTWRFLSNVMLCVLTHLIWNTKPNIICHGVISRNRRILSEINEHKQFWVGHFLWKEMLFLIAPITFTLLADPVKSKQHLSLVKVTSNRPTCAACWARNSYAADTLLRSMELLLLYPQKRESIAPLPSLVIFTLLVPYSL